MLLQVIWVCILCRKKQELLSKTGQWINKGMASGDPIMRRIEADLQQPVTPTDKRPKLERAHSAAEKENQPLIQRSGSVLRRQYSQQEQGRLAGSESGMDIRTQRAREEDVRFYRGELEGLMRSQQYASGRGDYRNDSLSSEQSSSMDCAPLGPPLMRGGGSGVVSSGGGGAPIVVVSGTKKHKRSGSTKKQSSSSGNQGSAGSRHHQQQQPPQRSFSSSDDETRSTPECTSCEEHDSEKGRFTIITLLFLLKL